MAASTLPRSTTPGAEAAGPPRTFRVFWLNMTLATPSPSASASALEFARKFPIPMPSSKPPSAASFLAVTSSIPTKAISGCVKQAAGMARWFT